MSDKQSLEEAVRNIRRYKRLVKKPMGIITPLGNDEEAFQEVGIKSIVVNPATRRKLRPPKKQDTQPVEEKKEEEKEEKPVEEKKEEEKEEKPAEEKKEEEVKPIEKKPATFRVVRRTTMYLPL